MIVYEATKQLFVEDVVQDKIEENIDRRFYEKMGYHTSKSERDAWKNSMQYMLKVLIDNNIPGNVGIAIEFKIPNAKGDTSQMQLKNSLDAFGMCPLLHSCDRKFFEGL